jgi:predicted amidophosphoribosyltransferase
VEEHVALQLVTFESLSTLRHSDSKLNGLVWRCMGTSGLHEGLCIVCGKVWTLSNDGANPQSCGSCPERKNSSCKPPNCKSKFSHQA